MIFTRLVVCVSSDPVALCSLPAVCAQELNSFRLPSINSLAWLLITIVKMERVTMKSLMRLFARGFHACVLLVFRCVGWVTFASGRDAPCRFEKCAY